MISKFKSKKISILILFSFFCSCVTQVQDTKRKPIYDNTSDMYEVPKKHEKKNWKEGTVVPVEKNQPAPFRGILITEERASDAALLRISYDELHGIAEVNRRLAKTVLAVADKQLEDADKEINRLKDQNNSWWTRNKFTVGLIIGIFATALTGGLLYWGASELQKQ